MTRLHQPLPPIDLVDLDGQPTSLTAQQHGRPLLVVAVRYYGCLPCQHHLVEVHARRDELTSRGVDTVVVGVAADFQARHLERSHGITFPMLLDPEQRFYRALELRNLRVLDFLRPRTWKVYLPLFWRRYVRRSVGGPTQGRPVGDITQLPGLALLDADGRLQWVHRGEALGDYPPFDDVLATIDTVLPAAAA